MKRRRELYRKTSGETVRMHSFYAPAGLSKRILVRCVEEDRTLSDATCAAWSDYLTKAGVK